MTPVYPRSSQTDYNMYYTYSHFRHPLVSYVYLPLFSMPILHVPLYTCISCIISYVMYVYKYINDAYHNMTTEINKTRRTKTTTTPIEQKKKTNKNLMLVQWETLIKRMFWL